MAVLIKTAAVSTTRPGNSNATVLTNVGVNISSSTGARAEYTAGGALIRKVLMLDPGTDIKQGDIVTITSENGFPVVEATAAYTVAEPPENKGMGGLAYVRARLVVPGGR